MDIPSLRDPQLEPSDSCYALLSDHGPSDGGWGPLAVSILGLDPAPIVYTGSDAVAIEGLHRMAESMAKITGKTTKVCRYHQREDLATYGGGA